MPTLFPIRTERFTLRPFVPQDAPALAAFGGDPEVARMTGSFPPDWTVLQAEEWIIRNAHQGGSGFALAILSDTAEIVGEVGLSRDPVMLGYAIARDHWGQGIATEAASAVLHVARTQLDVNEVGAVAFDENPASAAVLCKLGFKKIGEKPIHSKARLEPQPGSVYRLTL